MPDELDLRMYADIFANHIVDWLTEKGIDESLQAIGGDSNNMKGRRCHALGWMKTVPEIGLYCLWSSYRVATSETFNCTQSKNKWYGLLGKMLDANDLDINPDISKVLLGPPLITLSD